MLMTDVPKDDGRMPTKNLVDRWLEEDAGKLVDLNAMSESESVKVKPLSFNVAYPPNYDPFADTRTDEERRRDFLAKCDEITKQNKK